jgi:hypothetical protein
MWPHSFSNHWTSRLAALGQVGLLVLAWPAWMLVGAPLIAERLRAALSPQHVAGGVMAGAVLAVPIAGARLPVLAEPPAAPRDHSLEESRGDDDADPTVFAAVVLGEASLRADDKESLLRILAVPIVLVGLLVGWGLLCTGEGER